MMEEQITTQQQQINSRKGSKNRFSTQYDVHGCYKYYRSKLTKVKKLDGTGYTYCGYNLDRAKYKKVARKLNQGLAELIADGLELKLPYRLGSISPVAFKQKASITPEGKIDKSKKAFVDYKKTLELWKANPNLREQKKLIYNTSENTWFIKWHKRRTMIVHARSYQFVPCRGLKKLVVAKIKEGKTYYNA